MGRTRSLLRTQPLADDRGEIGSWLVVAAFLAMAAAAAAGPMQGFIADQVAAIIGSGATSDVSGDAAEPGTSPESTTTAPTGTSDREASDPEGPAIAPETTSQDGGNAEPTGPGADGPNGAEGVDEPTNATDEPAPGEDPLALPPEEELAHLNDLADRLPADADPRDDGYNELLDSLEDIVGDPETAQDVLQLVLDGYPVEIALAAVTGDWSQIPGGDPAAYDDRQIALVITALGFGDLPPHDMALLFSVLEPELIASVYLEAELALSDDGVVTYGGLTLDPNNVTIGGDGSPVDVSQPNIGIGFGQTQSIDISFQSEGDRSRLGFERPAAIRALRTLTTAAGLHPGLSQVLERNPMLRRVLRGVPFDAAYEWYTAIEVGYSATLTTDQASAFASGDSSALPNLYDPSSFETGNSILIRGGDIEGSAFLARYNAVTVDGAASDFEGIGFGATALEDGVMAIYAGDIEIVESEFGIGVAGTRVGKNTENSSHQMAYAEVDLNTPEGRAAYELFVTSGIVPTADAAGVTTAEANVYSTDYEVSGSIFGAESVLSHGTYETEVLTFADGSELLTYNQTSGDDRAAQIVVPTSNGEPDLDNAEITLVVGDVGGDYAHFVGLGYDGITGDHSGEIPPGDFNLQVTFTAPELLELQGLAQDMSDRGMANHWAIADLAAADGVDEIMDVLLWDGTGSQFDDPFYVLHQLSVDGDPDESFIELPGTMVIQPD